MVRIVSIPLRVALAVRSERKLCRYPSSRLIAFDPIVAPFSVDVPDTVKMRVIAVVDLADDAPIGLRFVGTDRDRPMQTDTLYRLVEKGLGRLRIPPRGEAEVDHLAVCVDGAPEVAPLAADADVGLIDMPVHAGPAQMLLGAPGQFWTELLDPAIHRRAINRDVALCQKIDDILIRQRLSQIPPHRTKNDVTRKAMVFERRSTCHEQPQKPKLGRHQVLTQQSPSNSGVSHFSTCRVVRTKPGNTQFTRIPSGPRSRACACVSPSIAALAVT